MMFKILSSCDVDKFAAFGIQCILQTFPHHKRHFMFLNKEELMSRCVCHLSRNYIVIGLCEDRLPFRNCLNTKNSISTLKAKLRECILSKDKTPVCWLCEMKSKISLNDAMTIHAIKTSSSCTLAAKHLKVSVKYFYHNRQKLARKLGFVNNNNFEQWCKNSSAAMYHQSLLY